VRKLIAFDDDTFDKLKQLARAHRPQGRAAQERRTGEGLCENQEKGTLSI
jgi:hypothetical protein